MGLFKKFLRDYLEGKGCSRGVESGVERNEVESVGHQRGCKTEPTRPFTRAATGLQLEQFTKSVSSVHSNCIWFANFTEYRVHELKLGITCVPGVLGKSVQLGSVGSLVFHLCVGVSIFSFFFYYLIKVCSFSSNFF